MHDTVSFSSQFFFALPCSHSLAWPSHFCLIRTVGIPTCGTFVFQTLVVEGHGQQFPTSGWVWGQYRYSLLLRKSRRQPDRPLAAEHPNTGMSVRTDWSTIECQETFEFCLFVDVSFSSGRNHRARVAYRVFKADVLRESKKSAWFEFPSSEIDDRNWPLLVIVRVLRGRVRLGKGEK